jgi:2-polyprenyl-6-methoxyphenol hydroxylase-like FAD-dependent oxidoreductase
MHHHEAPPCPSVFHARTSAHSAAADSYDIVVYGGSSGGVTAAIQAARMGKTAVLIEPTKFLGGLTTGGLGATDIGNKKAIGGMSREFYANASSSYYADPAKWKQQTREEYYAKTPARQLQHRGRPCGPSSRMRDEIYDAMLAKVKDKVTVVFGERLDLKKGVVKERHPHRQDRHGERQGVRRGDVHRRHL